MCVGNTEIKDEVLCAKPFSFNSCIGRYISSFHFTTVGREFMHRIYSLNYVNSTWFLTAPPPQKKCVLVPGIRIYLIFALSSWHRAKILGFPEC